MLLMHSDSLVPRTSQAVTLGWNGHLSKSVGKKSHSLQCNKVEILMRILLCLLVEVQNLKSAGKKNPFQQSNAELWHHFSEQALEGIAFVV